MSNFNYGPELGDPEEELPCIINTPVNGKDYTWYPDVNLTTKGMEFNFLLHLLLTRNGHVVVKWIKVKTDYQLKDLDEEDHLIVLQHLSIALGFILFPTTVTVLSVHPIPQKRVQNAS